MKKKRRDLCRMDTLMYSLTSSVRRALNSAQRFTCIYATYRFSSSCLSLRSYTYREDCWRKIGLTRSLTCLRSGTL